MGTWGTDILANDTTAEIWAEFKELFNKGLSCEEIRLKLEKEFHPDADSDYYGEVWTGIAYGQWMCGNLEEYTLERVIAATNKENLNLFTYDEKLLQQRIKILKDFCKKIQTPRVSPLKRKKPTERPPYFKKGDVIGIKVDAENYLGALVVDQNDFPEYGENTIVISSMIFKQPIPVDDFLKAEVLYLDIGGPTAYHRSYFWAIFAARNMSRKIKHTIKIGDVELKTSMSLGRAIRIGNWNKIPELYKEQVEFLKNNQSEKPAVLTINDILHPVQELQDTIIEWDTQRWLEILERAKMK